MIQVGPKETVIGITVIVSYVLFIVYLIVKAAKAKGKSE